VDFRTAAAVSGAKRASNTFDGEGRESSWPSPRTTHRSRGDVLAP
jgi:hypothetical protein